MAIFDLEAILKFNTSELDKGISELQTKLSKFSSGMGKVGKAVSTIGKVGAAAIGAGSAAVGALAKKSLDSYAEYEQLAGGIETLFEDLSWDVAENASKAFATAGMSVNEYYETAMGFAASLNQSLKANEGNIARAASATDQIIIDMSDNANKMGTSLESIQSAYSGFAKQNYTMLDNLKLGYGGTKSEMERLMKDATKLTGKKYNVENFADIAEAIHVIQDEMGITGTTSKEATSTIEGSLKSVKASWSNLVTELGKSDGDISGAASALADNVTTYIGNAMPRIEQILSGVGGMIENLAPVIGENLPKLIEQVAPSLLNAATVLIGKLASALPSMLDSIWNAIRNAFDSAGFGNIAEAMDRVKNAIMPLIDAIAKLVTNEAVVSAATKVFNGALDMLTAAIEVVASILTEAISIITKFVTWLDSGTAGAEALKVVIIAITAAIVAYNAVMVIMEVKAKLAAAAQLLLNAAMSANPIGIVIALIAGLVAAFVTLWNKCEGFRNFWISAWEKIKSIFTGFVEAWKAGVQTIKGWIDKALGFIRDLASGIGGILGGLGKKAVQWGKDMIEGFTNGVKKVKDKVVGAVKGVGEKIKSFLHFSRPDEGPLRDYETWMPDFMTGLANGIEKNRYKVIDAVRAVTEGMQMQDMTVGVNAAVTGRTNGANAISYAGATFNISVAADTSNPRMTAERIAQELATLTMDNASMVGGYA
jgi:phage-related protein